MNLREACLRSIDRAEAKPTYRNPVKIRRKNWPKGSYALVTLPTTRIWSYYDGKSDRPGVWQATYEDIVATDWESATTTAEGNDDD